MTSCPHRPPCPGCPRYGEPGIEARAADALAELAAQAGLAQPTLIEGRPLGYRLRSRLAVRGRAASPHIGIFEQGSHRVVDIPRCGVHHPLVNRVAAAVRQALRRTGCEPYAESSHRGLLRYLQVVVERASQSAQIVLVCNASRPEPSQPLARALEEALGQAIHSLWWNGNPERGNTILGPHWQRLRGPEAVREKIGGACVFFPPGAFGQANLDLAERLAQRIADWVPEGSRVLELYAGCGMIGLPLLPRVARLELNERSEHALRGLALGLARLPAQEQARVRLHTGAAGDHAEGLARIAENDVVIADPPRRGLDPPLLQALADAPPARFVYMSCGLDSFLAQARSLLSAGRVRMTALEVCALFPQTAHVETLALFERV